jgi:hypothetical protein
MRELANIATSLQVKKITQLIFLLCDSYTNFLIFIIATEQERYISSKKVIATYSSVSVRARVSGLEKRAGQLTSILLEKEKEIQALRAKLG